VRRALQLELYPGHSLPPVSAMSMCLAKLVDVCPFVRSMTLLHATRPEIAVRIRLAWWTWLACGLIHRHTARQVVRYQRLWCPPDWKVLVVVS